MDYQGSQAKNKIATSFEHSCTSLEFSIESWMEELKPADTKKDEFDNRGFSMSTEVFGIFQTTKILIQELKLN